MSLSIREAGPDDAPACAEVCFRAFDNVARRYGHATDVASVEDAMDFIPHLISHHGYYCAVAEEDGRVVGSNIFDERSLIRGIGPITVDPDVQSRSVGRRLMEHVLDRSRDRNAVGVRLCQDSYNTGSLSLYSKLGFRVREPLAAMQGSVGDVVFRTAPSARRRRMTLLPAMSCATASTATTATANSAMLSPTDGRWWWNTKVPSPGMRRAWRSTATSRAEATRTSRP
ncbi:MAG: GNAT family N-acetyltransferase [Rhodospirillaceae bacterium]|nr:GNAT family N-acetyltransferase [Rhodospirillaceae bacterium]MBT6508881.1 GNAT family N-acetyltransferase [Rhodospirillaceae bacterium]MBT7614804.1 GNAT family N-acetyltransferase [Rhodospirillaceae bacterium]